MARTRFVDSLAIYAEVLATAMQLQNYLKAGNENGNLQRGLGTSVIFSTNRTRDD